MTELDNEIKEQSVTFAKDLVAQFKMTALDPNIRHLSDNEEKIKEELRSWGFFEKFPVASGQWDELYTYIIAMNKYKSLKHIKDNPPKSKWEFVCGRMGKNNARKK